MKTLAIIGASYLQRPLVEKAKEMGLRTICFAWAEGAVCSDIADVFYPISIVEKEQILEVCKQEHIDGICTIASDVAAPTVAYVAEQMGLIGNTYEASLRANNKWLMRQAFTLADVPCPQYMCVTNATMDMNAIQAKVSLPLIVKPSDRSGSLAVNKITDWVQLPSAIQDAQSASFKNEAMVEEFIEGREISVEFISYKGKHYPLQITDKVTTGAPHFVELEHHQPSTLSDAMYATIYAITERALDALGITNGASHTEYKITNDGQVYIMELGARMGGDFIGSDLVQLSTGYDFLRGVIEVALGEFNEPLFLRKSNAGVYFLSAETPHLAHYIRYAKHYATIITAEQTDLQLRHITCSSDRSGYVTYQGDSRLIDDTKEKILIIGAGTGQVPLIRAAKERGLYTLVVSILGDYPGIKEADQHLIIDIYDKDLIVEIAKAENVRYVLSDQSDFAVPTVAYVAEKLGLKGNSVATAELFTNKQKQRDFCIEQNFRVPVSCLVRNEDDLSKIAMSFPWVIKPVDSQGSRGISVVDNMIDALSAFSEACRFSKRKEVVVEEYFEGKEVVCEGWVMDGVYHNIAFADRHYFNIQDKFIPSQTVFPSLIDTNVSAEIISQESELVKRANVQFGIVHSEYLIKDSGEFCLVETALRGGGVYISSHLIPCSYGVDLTGLLLDYVLHGCNAVQKYLIKKTTNRVSAYVCFYLQSGVVGDVLGSELVKCHPQIIQADIEDYVPGFVYTTMEHKGNRLGPILISASSHDELSDIMQWLHDTYKIYMIDYKENAVIWE